MTAAPKIDECGAGWQTAKQIGVQNTGGRGRQGQKIDEDLSFGQDLLETGRAPGVGDARVGPRALAPGANREPQGRQALCDRLSHFSEAQDAHFAMSRYGLRLLPPRATRLLQQVRGELSMEVQHS